jgi:AraC-like DNA-binding protein/DNA gyrase inhibitor GyrI
MEKLLLEDLAGKVGLSPFYFQRLFKKEMKESPLAYLNRVKLEKAGHLLKAGTVFSISQMAEDCGFSSAAVFNRAFKKRFKMTPQEFMQSPAPSIVEMLKKETIDYATVDIVYLPETYIFVVPVSINDGYLLHKIDNLIAICNHKNIGITGKKMGIITHDTFQNPEAKHNYHVGITINSNPTSLHKDQLYVISQGKYACFVTTEPFNKTREVLTAFKIGWLDKSLYTWRELICYEEFLVDNDADPTTLHRRMYVPVKRK